MEINVKISSPKKDNILYNPKNKNIVEINTKIDMNYLLSLLSKDERFRMHYDQMTPLAFELEKDKDVINFKIKGLLK